MNVKNRLEIYKCSVCGNVVEVIFAGGGELVCCGKPMILQIENTVDASKEKHLPVIEKTADGYKVKVGSVPHPMEEKHFITMIELTVDGNVCTKILKPGEAPEAIFCVKGSVASAREYCSLHGLWKV
ncbi:MAG: desulfoferrodoxin [Candidatus Firestonebacteria bacterium RIFOXYC2_FULL_39_67]|nr:MAG: desulfoferrodoxin [Candidatus Firestonebacteria bacterium RIFOXYD2_FULL_39_29]OGF55965.1 MAG: desulfoferrodoxin [Candidatus Firestonebacteria bacterium RIFOXYC2_FULL_39_67]OGF57814.1 MAG: desulfoferrodoxin [Candidatus Firestonebacteria bacterium RifOxyC12_full_39_7]